MFKSSDLRIIAAVCLNRDFYPVGDQICPWRQQWYNRGSSGDENAHEYTFQGVRSHRRRVFIVVAVVRASSAPIAMTGLFKVGIGDYYVAIGDSITVGEGDDISEDNQLELPETSRRVSLRFSMTT